MSDAQGPEETLRASLERWRQIAERHASETEGYKLYPGDWAALASVLRKAMGGP